MIERIREKRKIRRERSKIYVRKMLKFLMIFIMTFAPIIGIIMISDSIVNNEPIDFFIFFTVLFIVEGVIFTIFTLIINWESIVTKTRDYYVHNTAIVCGIFLIFLSISAVFTLIAPYPSNIGFIVLDIIFSVILVIILPLPFNIIIISLVIFLLITFAPESEMPSENKMTVIIALIIVTVFFGVLSEVVRSDWRKKSLSTNQF